MHLASGLLMIACSAAPIALWVILCPGYYFRQKTYSEVERVLDAFKRDPNYKKKQRADGIGQPRMAGPPGRVLGAELGQSECYFGRYTVMS